MKKKYVAPKSELFALQLNENMAASGGGDVITGGYEIRFTQAGGGCRGLYSGVAGAIVTVGPNAEKSAYKNELETNWVLGLINGEGSSFWPYTIAHGTCMS